MQRHLPMCRCKHGRTGLAGRWGVLLAVAPVIALAGGCGGGEGTAISTQPAATDVAFLTLSPTSLTLSLGQQKLITATARNAAGAPLAAITPAWATSATTVATVDAAGNVTGVGVGTATVTASAGGKSAVAAVTVTPPTLDGRWVGTTATGDSVSFTVLGTSVTDASIKFRLTGDCAIGAITIHIVGPSGSVSGQQVTLMSGTDIYVAGTFFSFDGATGSGTYALHGTSPTCTSTASTSWTAHKI